MHQVGVLSPLITVTFLTEMITTKQIILDVIKDTAECQNLNRLEKFNVFCNVCDNMLKEGRITSAKHKQWTEIY